MPSITQNRMRLARMTGAQALSRGDASPAGSSCREEVAEARSCASSPAARSCATPRSSPRCFRSICRELNNARLAQGRAEISADLLAGSRDTILSEFYERALADQPPGVRRFIEDELLTESGYRESLAEERVTKGFAAAGAAPDALATLVDRRLLRVEDRLDVRRVELTHDVLRGVVQASRDLRHEREARDDAERQLAEQREREGATHQALVRARKIAAGCAVLAVFAVAGAVFGFFNMRRAQQAEAKAQATRLLAETARGEAEKLVVYLLDDFYQELAPVGRLDIVGALARRALDYYDGLPAALQTPATQRNRALALVRYGAVLRSQDKLAEGGKAIDEAVGMLETMRDQGDLSETTAIGLALGLAIQSRLAASAEAHGEGLKATTRALDVMKPLATAPDASVAVRRAYAEVLNQHGFLLNRNDQNKAAIEALELARGTLAGIDGGKLDDLAAAALYAEATSWQVQALINLDRGDEAKRAGKEALAVAAKVLDKRPGHMQALRAQALTTSPLAALLIDEMHLSEALAMSDTTLKAWREFIRLDPGNTISWANLAVVYFNRNAALDALGKPADTVAELHTALNLDAAAPPGLLLRRTLTALAGRLAILEADRGNRKESDEALAAGRRLLEMLAARSPAGTFTAVLPMTAPEVWNVAAWQARGDDARALDAGRAVLPKLDALRADDPEQKRVKFYFQRILLRSMARSAYALKDYAAASRYMAGVAEIDKGRPRHGMGEKREIVNEQAFAALVLARLNRLPEAQALAAESLKFERELSPRNVDDPSQRLDLAISLYVAAVSGLGDRAAQLAEAAALVDRLPAGTRALASTTQWRARIAEEQKTRG